MAQRRAMLLDQQLCFSLYAASRAVTAAYRPMLAGLGLTYPQYLTMLVVWERGEVSMKDLGAALELDYGTLTPLIKRLAAAGLVIRQRQSVDERAVHVVATDAGRALRRRAQGIPDRIADVFALSEGQLAALQGELRSLTDKVNQHLAGL